MTKTVEAKFTHKELCYLIMPLQLRIRELEFEVFKTGHVYGNIGHLISFSKRLEKKLARPQKASL
jgi:hypothetical protein